MNRIVKEIELTFDEYNKRLMDMSRYIGSDGSGNYNCTLCDHKWRAYKPPLPVQDDILSATFTSESEQ